MTCRMRYRLVTALVAGLAASPLHAQKLGGAPDDPVSWVRVGVALVVCCAAACGLAVVLKARGVTKAASWAEMLKPKHSRIERVVSRRLSLQCEVHIVRCDGVEYVLLCGPGGNQIMERRAVPQQDEKIVAGTD